VIRCTWELRRHAARFGLAIGLVVASLSLVTPSASATSIDDLKAQAAALEAKITTLGQQESALAEQYDGAVLAVQTAQTKVNEAAQQVTAADANSAKAKASLQQEAVTAYIDSGNTGGGGGSSGNTLSGANNGLLRAEYVDTLTADSSDAEDQYHLASLQAAAAKSNYEAQQAAAQASVSQVSQAKQAVQASKTQRQAALNSDNGQIATLIAQQQAAAAAAAQQAAAAAAAARSNALSSSSSSSSAPSGPAPPVSQNAAGAVAAALSRVGDTYVWGGSGPTDFDCSGLVMWAYAQAGLDLPHFSGAQYSDSTHISMSQLEPGDLVFPSDPTEHVAMYIGGGQIVEAPETGVPVHVVPLSSWFVLAARPA
jgi:cell wall-associated NlpC family hydrolase